MEGKWPSVLHGGDALRRAGRAQRRGRVQYIQGMPALAPTSHSQATGCGNEANADEREETSDEKHRYRQGRAGTVEVPVSSEALAVCLLQPVDPQGAIGSRSGAGTGCPASDRNLALLEARLRPSTLYCILEFTDMIGEALKIIRRFHDVKQWELAEAIGISRSYLSEIESGTKDPTLDIVKKYSDYFSIPMSSIIFFAESIDDGSPRSDARKLVSRKILDLMRFLEARRESCNEEF